MSSAVGCNEGEAVAVEARQAAKRARGCVNLLPGSRAKRLQALVDGTLVRRALLYHDGVRVVCVTFESVDVSSTLHHAGGLLCLGRVSGCKAARDALTPRLGYAFTPLHPSHLGLNDDCRRAS